jgi:hypothetical protein
VQIEETDVDARLPQFGGDAFARGKRSALHERGDVDVRKRREPTPRTPGDALI